MHIPWLIMNDSLVHVILKKTNCIFAIERLFIYHFLTYLPRSRHFCLCCRWPVSFQTEPRPHTWPRSHDLLTRSGTVNTHMTDMSVRQDVNDVEFLRVWNWCLCKNEPQNHHSSSSRCMLWHQSWRMPDISRRETRPPFWLYAGVHRTGHTYIPNCPLRIKITRIRHKQ